MTAAETRLKNISAQKNSRPLAASIEELMSAKAKNMQTVFKKSPRKKTGNREELVSIPKNPAAQAEKIQND